MKTIRSYGWMGFFALALIMSCLGAGVANAQEARGQFTLPFDTCWGQVTLPAGDYSFVVDQAQSASRLVLFHGTEGVAIIHSQGYNPKDADRSFLKVVQERGIASVRELTLADPGVVLYYGAHRPKPGSAAAEREISQLIPVTMPKK